MSTLARALELKPSARLIEILSDDLNTPSVILTHLFDLVKQADQKGGIKKEPVVALYADLLFLGLDPFRFASDESEKIRTARNIDGSLVHSLVVARLEARKNKYWKESEPYPR